MHATERDKHLLLWSTERGESQELAKRKEVVFAQNFMARAYFALALR
jgi:hypothetical protein